MNLEIVLTSAFKKEIKKIKKRGKDLSKLTDVVNKFTFLIL